MSQERRPLTPAQQSAENSERAFPRAQALLQESVRAEERRITAVKEKADALAAVLAPFILEEWLADIKKAEEQGVRHCSPCTYVWGTDAQGVREEIRGMAEEAERLAEKRLRKDGYAVDRSLGMCTIRW